MKIYKLVLCAWAIGIGLRFIVSYMRGSEIYLVNRFDTFFDWGLLVASGLLTLIDELVRFWRKKD